MSRPDKDLEALQFIEDVTSKCDEVQRKVLAEILSQNAGTEYLKRQGVKGDHIDLDTFKSKVPLVTYENIKHHIQRIADGDCSPILCAQPIVEFLTSSGTSKGESKMIPTTAEEIDRKIFFYSLSMPVIKQYMPGVDQGKALYFQFIKAETKTPGGLVVHPVSTSFYKSMYIKNRSSYNVHTSPIEAIFCPDSFQSMYTQMLCGLYDRHTVLRIGAGFATGLLRAIQFLKVHHLDLCHDIATGTLSPKITHSGIRAHMAETMRPNPELAEFIKNACQGEIWEGIIKTIWPNTKYLDVIVTGVMAQYVPKLDYYSGGLPKVSKLYSSAECFIGLNLNPMSAPSKVSYTVMPNMAYFEFIPVDDLASSVPRLVDLVDVEVGKEYELVATTPSGLYRYRIGDVLRVTGFYNSAPQFKFIRRKDVVLSIDADKTNESDLQKAIENASTLLHPYNTSIVDYTSRVDTNKIPGHYVIYWELLTKDPTNGPGHDVLGQCCLAMEEALDSVYRQSRVADQSIGPLEIRVVKNGTFEELMVYAITTGTSINQYKVPRCVNHFPIVELMDSRVVSAHFSPSLPHWTSPI